MKKQLFILLLLVSGNVLAQRAAVKTNLLHDVATHLRLLPSGRLPPAGHSMLREAPVRGILRTTGSGNSG